MDDSEYQPEDHNKSHHHQEFQTPTDATRTEYDWKEWLSQKCGFKVGDLVQTRAWHNLETVLAYDRSFVPTFPVSDHGGKVLIPKDEIVLLTEVMYNGFCLVLYKEKVLEIDWYNLKKI